MKNKSKNILSIIRSFVVSKIKSGEYSGIITKQYSDDHQELLKDIVTDNLDTSKTNIIIKFKKLEYEITFYGPKILTNIKMLNMEHSSIESTIKLIREITFEIEEYERLELSHF